MMFSCKQASRLLSMAQDRPLTTGETVKLHFHLAMCDACRNFNRQLKIIRLGARTPLKSSE